MALPVRRSTRASHFQHVSGLLLRGLVDLRLVLVGQITTGVLVVLGLLWVPFMKYIAGQLYVYLQSVQGYIAPPIAAVFLLGLCWKRLNAQGAMTALLMAWSGAPTALDAFGEARDTVVSMYRTRRRPGRCLSGFLTRLQSSTARLLTVLMPALRKATQEAAGASLPQATRACTKPP